MSAFLYSTDIEGGNDPSIQITQVPPQYHLDDDEDERKKEASPSAQDPAFRYRDREDEPKREWKKCFCLSLCPMFLFVLLGVCIFLLVFLGRRDYHDKVVWDERGDVDVIQLGYITLKVLPDNLYVNFMGCHQNVTCFIKVSSGIYANTQVGDPVQFYRNRICTRCQQSPGSAGGRNHGYAVGYACISVFLIFPTAMCIHAFFVLNKYKYKRLGFCK